MTTHTSRIFFSMALFVAAASLFAGPAHADVAVAGDLDYALPLEDATDSGGGFGVRLGRRFDAPLIALTPELALSYHGFSGGYAPSAYRGMGGLRLDVGEILTPGVFAHLGIGHLNGGSNDGRDTTRTSFAFDAGAFIDLTILPLLNVGAHAAYNYIGRSDDTLAFDWLTFGLHAALIF